MRLRIGVLVALLALTGAACQQNDDDPDVVGETDLSSEEFALTGTVLDAKAGVEPEGGFPEEQDPAPTGEEPTYGGIAIRADNEDAATNLDDCPTQHNAYVTYYVEDSDFEPAELEDEADFPVSLEGQRVTVMGTVEAPSEDEDTDVDADAEAQTDDGDAQVEGEVETTTEPENTGETRDSEECVLIIEELEIAEAAGTDAGQTGTGTDEGAGGATDDPDATEDPDATTEPGSTPGLPAGVEDTDPIFGGTPSPDPCEGQKACEENDQ